MLRALSRLALASLGLLLALVLVEALLRLFPAVLPRAVAANAGIVTESNVGVERFRRAWMASQTIDSVLGFRSVANLDMQLTGHPDFEFHLRTNQYGFRSRYLDGPVDIVTVGDSFTFGYGVDDDATWPALLEDATSLSVANLGQTGYGPQQELFVLESEGAKLQPKLVIWEFFVNDFLDASSFKAWEDAGKPNVFEFEQQQLAQTAVEQTISGPVATFRGFLHSYLVSYELAKYMFGLGAYRWKRLQEIPVRTNGSRLYLNQAQLDGWSNPEWLAITSGRELTEETLLVAREQTLAIDASFLVVLIPSKEEVYASELGSKAQQDPWSRPRNSQLILDFCQQHHINCFDSYETIRRAVDSGAVPYFQHDGHLNPTGHRILASAIAEYLEADMNRR